MNTRHPDPTQYADEVRDRLFNYPCDFRFLRIERQIDRLDALMGIHPAYPDHRDPRHAELPNGAEGWVVVPTLHSLYCPEPQLNLTPALNNVLQRLEYSSRWRSRHVTIENNLKGGLLRAKVPDLKTRYDTHRISRALRAFPAQLGTRFGNTCVSPRRAEVLFDENEFGLDVVTILMIVVTHWDDLKDATLRINCPGSEYAPNGDSNTCTETPRIDIAQGAIALDLTLDQHARGFHATASGWAV